MALPQRLHLGCGLTTPQGWLNVDGSLNARLAKHPRARRLLARLGVLPAGSEEVGWSRDVFIHDVRTPLPWPDASFTHVYTSHLLEHLHLAEGRRLLKDCARVLRPGGVLRVVVPDLRAALDDYFARRKHPLVPVPADLAQTPGDVLNMRLLYHDIEPVGGGPVMKTYRLHHNFHQHKWMYDEESLCLRLREAGFAGVKRMGVFESRIPDIRTIEQPDRVEDGGLAVEGVKPGA